MNDEAKTLAELKKQLRHHAKEILRILEAPKAEPEKKKKVDPLVEAHIALSDKKKAKISPKKGTSFKMITIDEQEFDIIGVDVMKIYPEKSGSTSGKAWSKQSVIIRDAYDEQRELLAWGETIDKYRSLRVGDRIDIFCLKKVSRYERQDGTTITQYVLGGNTDIKIQESGEEHVL